MPAEQGDRMDLSERTYKCPTCWGTGSIESSDSTDDRWWDCRRCEGTGKMADRRRPLRGAVSNSERKILRGKNEPAEAWYERYLQMADERDEARAEVESLRQQLRGAVDPERKADLVEALEGVLGRIDTEEAAANAVEAVCRALGYWPATQRGGLGA